MKKVIEIIKRIIVSVFIVSISITICMRSELNPIANKIPTIDSDVYIYIAEEMNNGKVVYKDIFDHKGPLYHFIEYIGVKLSFDYGYIGVWIIEVISMCITMLFLYKTSKLITKNRFLSILAVFVSAVPLSLFFINGNYTEEYSLPFISVSLYFLIKCLINSKELSKMECSIIGFCLGCVALIKLNLISVWIVFVVAILVRVICQKKWEELKKIIIYMTFGALIPISIAFIVLLLQGNLIDCFKQYIIFNFKYATDTEGELKEVLELFGTKVYCISLAVCVIDFLYRIIAKKSQKHLSILSFIYLILTFLIVIMPINPYVHYGIILTPTYIIPLSLIEKDFFDLIEADNSKITFVIATVFLLYLVLVVTRRDISVLKKDLLVNNSERFIFRETALSRYIKENTDKDDNILVLGNECNIYLMSERFCNCKYVYQVPIVRIDSNILREVISEIKENKPELIVLKHTQFLELEETFYKYLEETNDYKMVTNFDFYDIYVLND